MLNLCEKVTKIFRNRSTATVRTDFVTFSHRFSILDIHSRFQSPFLGLLEVPIRISNIHSSNGIFLLGNKVARRCAVPHLVMHSK